MFAKLAIKCDAISRDVPNGTTNLRRQRDMQRINRLKKTNKRLNFTTAAAATVLPDIKRDYD